MIEQKLLNSIEVLNLTEVRISSASFTRIRDEDGRFALLINKNRANKGDIILTPIGGGIEATDEGLNELKRVLEIDDTTFEKGRDLRFSMAGVKANQYRDWFLKRQGREINPLREISEELIDEEGLLASEDLSGIEFSLVGYDKELEVTTRTGQEGKKTLRLLEIFEAKIKAEAFEKLKHLSTQSNPVIYFVTADEIQRGQTINGIKIGTVAKALLKPKGTIEAFQ